MTTSPVLGGFRHGKAAPGPERSPIADGEDLDAINGYLLSIAEELSRRRIAVRVMHADLGQGPAGPVPAATVILDLAPCPHPRWVPTCLRWQADEGWSATLRLTGGDRRGCERRYLPGSVVPSPVAVAHFAAALIVDPDTHWASRFFDRPRPLNHHRLAMALARSAEPGDRPDTSQTRRQSCGT